MKSAVSRRLPTDMAGGYWIAARLDPYWGTSRTHTATYKPFELCEHGFLVKVCEECREPQGLPPGQPHTGSP